MNNINPNQEQESDYEDILSSIRDMLESDDELPLTSEMEEETQYPAQNSGTASIFKVTDTKAINGTSAKIFELTPDMLVLLGSKVKIKDKATLQSGPDGSLDAIFKKWLISHKKEIIELIKSDKAAK